MKCKVFVLLVTLAIQCQSFAQCVVKPQKMEVKAVQWKVEKIEDALVLNLARGRSALLRVVDKAGKPWPIRRVLSGNENELDVRVESRSTLFLMPRAAYKATNVLMMLEGLDDGVMVVVRDKKQEQDDSTRNVFTLIIDDGCATPRLSASFTQKKRYCSTKSKNHDR